MHFNCRCLNIITLMVIYRAIGLYGFYIKFNSGRSGILRINDHFATMNFYQKRKYVETEIIKKKKTRSLKIIQMRLFMWSRLWGDRTSCF